jgi:dephospho-CoA kinase
MKLAGLAGGIGSGKSTVAGLLTAKGALAVDVDLLSRELQQPGRPVFSAMVGRWGGRILAPDGTLDRQAVADLVFHDPQEMAALHAMTDVAIEDAMYHRVSLRHGTDDIVLIEAALLAGAPRGLYGTSGLLIVDAPDEVAIDRLVRSRGMGEADARARLASQSPREVRLARGDFIIDNAGLPDELDPQVQQAWEWLHSLPDGLFERRTPSEPNASARLRHRSDAAGA